MVFYSLSIVTIAISLAISEIFSIKEWSDLEICVWGRWKWQWLVGSWKPILQHVPCHILPGRTWRQTSHAAGRAGVFPPAQATHIILCVLAVRCRTLDWTSGRSWVTCDGSGTQTTWLCMRQCVTMRAPWVGQTDDGIYDVTITTHQTLCFHTLCHIHLRLPGIHQSVNQSSNTNIYSATSESDASHCTQRPVTTHRQHLACHDCQLSIRSSVNNQLSKFKDRLWNNLSFTSVVEKCKNFYTPSEFRENVWCW